MPDPNFFNFVINLVKLGGLGVGALIFVMAFLILFRNQAASTDMAAFRLSFLRWGFAFAVLALVASSATDLVTALRPSSSVKLGVTISPDFAEAKLPQPEIYLMPAGTLVKPNTPVDLQGSETLSIQVHGIVASVQGLAQSSETLLATNQKLTDAIDKSSQLVQDAAVSGAPPQAKVEALAQMPVLRTDELARIRTAQAQISTGLSTGNFAAAARNSTALHAITASSQGLNK